MPGDKQSLGFTGLKDLLPDVDAHVTQAQAKSKEEVAASTSPIPRRETNPSPPHVRKEVLLPEIRLINFLSENRAAIIVIVAVVVLGVLAFDTGKTSVPETRTPAEPSVARTAPPAAPTPASRPEIRLEDLQTPQAPPSRAAPARPSLPMEDKPPVGNGLSLSTAQIRYCVFEEVRIDALSPLINRFAEVEVDGFNGYVADYNNRCSRFRYKRGTLESVQAEVPRFREILEKQGQYRLLQWRRGGLLGDPRNFAWHGAALESAS